MNFIAAALTIRLFDQCHPSLCLIASVKNTKGIADIKIFGDVTDRSIKQTLARSINTSVDDTDPIVLILILGVPSIQNFAIALIVGIVSGTYSSVCIAGPLWVNLRKIGSGKKPAKA